MSSPGPQAAGVVPAQLGPIASPLSFDGRGRTAETPADQHLRDLIEEVLLTAPGERVMRPTFGSGLLQLAFAPNSDQLAAALQMLVQGALQSGLGDLIEVAAVTIAHNDETLTISVSYTVRSTGESTTATFAQLS
jgi:phage baseplate assembly protein W